MDWQTGFSQLFNLEIEPSWIVEHFLVCHLSLRDVVPICDPGSGCNAFRFVDLLDSTAAALSDYCQDPQLQRSGGVVGSHSGRIPRHAGSVVLVLPARAVQPRIVEVPNGPAFVRLPGMSEVDASSGQVLSLMRCCERRSLGECR